MTARTAPRRDGYVDLLRIIGVVAVVAGHIPEQVLPREVIYSWHVPLFFALSGYLAGRQRPLADEIGRRVKTLLVPYAVWGVLVTVGLVGLLLLGESVHPSLLAGAAWGGRYATSPFSASWFVAALFVAVVVAKGLRAGLPPWAQGGLGVLMLGAAAVVPEVAKAPFAIGQGLACVVFVQAGMLLRWCSSRVRTSSRRGVVGATALVAGVALVVAGTRPLDLKVLDVGTPVLSLVAALLVTSGAVLLPIRVHGGPATVSTALARVALVVVLVHPLVIRYLTHVDGLPAPVLLVLVLVVSWAIGLGAARTPFAWVLGAGEAPLATAPRGAQERSDVSR